MAVPYVYRRLTLQDFHILESLFCAFDRNDDQTIESTELFSIFKTIDSEVTKSTCEILLRVFDEDESG